MAMAGLSPPYSRGVLACLRQVFGRPLRASGRSARRFFLRVDGKPPDPRHSLPLALGIFPESIAEARIALAARDRLLGEIDTLSEVGQAGCASDGDHDREADPDAVVGEDLAPRRGEAVESCAKQGHG